MVVNTDVGYSGRREIVDAARKLQQHARAGGTEELADVHHSIGECARWEHTKIGNAPAGTVKIGDVPAGQALQRRRCARGQHTQVGGRALVDQAADRVGVQVIGDQVAEEVELGGAGGGEGGGGIGSEAVTA